MAMTCHGHDHDHGHDHGHDHNHDHLHHHHDHDQHHHHYHPPRARAMNASKSCSIMEMERTSDGCSLSAALLRFLRARPCAKIARGLSRRPPKVIRLSRLVIGLSVTPQTKHTRSWFVIRWEIPRLKRHHLAQNAAGRHAWALLDAAPPTWRKRPNSFQHAE